MDEILHPEDWILGIITSYYLEGSTNAPCGQLYPFPRPHSNHLTAPLYINPPRMCMVWFGTDCSTSGYDNTVKQAVRR